MAVMRWDPFAEVDRMFDLITGRGDSGAGQGATRGMPMDVYREGDKYVVEMDLPGVDPSTIDISVERNLLTVQAEGESKHEQADEVIICERRHVRYRRQLYLGEDVDSDNVQASYDNGVLRLQIPISVQQQARKIEVASEGEPKKLAEQTAQPQNAKDQPQQRAKEKADQSA